MSKVKADARPGKWPSWIPLFHKWDNDGTLPATHRCLGVHPGRPVYRRGGSWVSHKWGRELADLPYSVSVHSPKACPARSIERNVLPSVTQRLRHPDQFVQELLDSREERGIQ